MRAGATLVGAASFGGIRAGLAAVFFSSGNGASALGVSAMIVSGFGHKLSLSFSRNSNLRFDANANARWSFGGKHSKWDRQTAKFLSPTIQTACSPSISRPFDLFQK
jgi:hypothetical protein